ncbi:S-protein-like [Heracleum sosnowskyi]|uniref:S-protein homolog n=1 Tax=Heracleum sosnowskyi TaxID=360622 RepID=A0AAD8LXD9_9APIA|nr:S-protein-like [Heracleum sosnowskyi]
MKLVSGTGVDVKITSRMESVLALHCRSRDDDFGHSNLYTNEHFKWHFRPNILGRTLYYCTFDYGFAFKKIDVYNQGKYGSCSIHNPPSNACYWEVRLDGFYFNHYDEPNPHTPWKKLYDWDEHTD